LAHFLILSKTFSALSTSEGQLCCCHETSLKLSCFLLYRDSFLLFSVGPISTTPKPPEDDGEKNN